MESDDVKIFNETMKNIGKAEGVFRSHLHNLEFLTC